MTRYEFEDDDALTYDMYDLEVYDIDGETVLMTDATEDIDDLEEMFDKLAVGAGGTMVLRKLCYSNPNYTGYLKTVVIKTKK